MHMDDSDFKDPLKFSNPIKRALELTLWSGLNLSDLGDDNIAHAIYEQGGHSGPPFPALDHLSQHEAHLVAELIGLDAHLADQQWEA
jgi:hypothetical protein